MLGSKRGSCQTLPCSLNFEITDPTQSGYGNDIVSGAIYGWSAFNDGDYDLLVQDFQSQGTVYVVPFSYNANAAPVASNVSVSGTAQAGTQLTGAYTYTDTESNAEGTSTFRWVRNSVNTGVAGGTNVSTTLSYTPTADDVGNHLYFCVTPVATTGTTTGTEVCSVATAAVQAAPVNGSCGPASSQSYAVAPAANLLCSAGSASGFSSGGGQYSWSCSGSNGGTASSCSANWASNAGPGVGTVETSANNWVVGAASFSTSPPSTPPSGTTFPNGLLNLQLNSGTPGSNATVVVRFNTPVPAGAVYMKYGKTQDNQTDHWYQLPADRAVFAQDRLSVTLILTDGGIGDTDLAANGSISDPGGPALLSAGTPVSIPTLSEWGMILLASLMGLGTFVAMRKRTS